MVSESFLPESKTARLIKSFSISLAVFYTVFYFLPNSFFSHPPEVFFSAF